MSFIQVFARFRELNERERGLGGAADLKFTSATVQHRDQDVSKLANFIRDRVIVIITLSAAPHPPLSLFPHTHPVPSVVSLR